MTILMFGCVGMNGLGLVIEIHKDARKILLPDRLHMYRGDVEKFFDDYWSAHKTDDLILDFTVPAEFLLHGFEIPVWLSSFTEPVSDLMRYVDHANVSEGSVVIDAGAYCGLTAMLLHDRGARVFAFEPDFINAEQCKRNFELYEKQNGGAPFLSSLAIAGHVGCVSFCSEGAMGSNAILRRGASWDVGCLTLSAVVERYNLSTVDYVKMDIEGSEVDVLSDAEFFSCFHPRMSIEVHYDSAGVESLLRSYAYRWFVVPQPGSPFQLYQCY